MFDARLIQLLEHTINKTPAAPKLTANAKMTLVHTLYSQFEQQLSFTILEKLSADAKIQYLTMLEETVPQQVMQDFLQEHIPDINAVIQSYTENFLANYLQDAGSAH